MIEEWKQNNQILQELKKSVDHKQNILNQTFSELNDKIEENMVLEQQIKSQKAELEVKTDELQHKKQKKQKIIAIEIAKRYALLFGSSSVICFINV